MCFMAWEVWFFFNVKSEQANWRHYLPVIAKIELKFGMDGEIEISDKDGETYLISEMMWSELFWGFLLCLVFKDHKIKEVIQYFHWE